LRTRSVPSTTPLPILRDDTEDDQPADEGDEEDDEATGTGSGSSDADSGSESDEDHEPATSFLRGIGVPRALTVRLQQQYPLTRDTRSFLEQLGANKQTLDHSTLTALAKLVGEQPLSQWWAAEADRARSRFGVIDTPLNTPLIKEGLVLCTVLDALNWSPQAAAEVVARRLMGLCLLGRGSFDWDGVEALLPLTQGAGLNATYYQSLLKAVRQVRKAKQHRAPGSGQWQKGRGRNGRKRPFISSNGDGEKDNRSTSQRGKRSHTNQGASSAKNPNSQAAGQGAAAP
jgi:hypothetical protein